MTGHSNTDNQDNGPLVSFIITCYNGSSWIKNCLDSLTRQTFGDYEIVFVDNGSIDNPFDIIKESFPNVRTCRIEKNRGFTGGNNYGAKHAKGKLFFFVSVDVKLREDCLEKIIEYYKKDLGIVSPLILGYDDDKKIKAGSLNPENIKARYCGIDKYGYSYQLHNESGFYYIEGCSFMMSREIFERLGGFDEMLETYQEDVDLSWRSELLGKKNTILPQAVAFHFGGSASTNYGARTTEFNTTTYRRYHTVKNMMRNAIKNYAWYNTIEVIFVQLLLINVEAMFFLIVKRNLKVAGLYYRAIWWNIKNLRKTLSFRKVIQKTRTVPDSEITRKMAKFPVVFHTFLEKGAPKYI